MSDPGRILVDLLRWLAAQKAHALTIVECGAIRHPSFEGHDDGLSTYHIAKWMKTEATAHECVSCDVSHGLLRSAQAFLAAHGVLLPALRFALGDATLLLQHFRSPIDFCYLDAGADPCANLAQYRYATKWLRAPGMIVIDDVFDPRNADRGLVTVPYARLEGRQVANLGGRLALISFGVDDYPLPAGSTWL